MLMKAAVSGTAETFRLAAFSTVLGAWHRGPRLGENKPCGRVLPFLLRRVPVAADLKELVAYE
jgi:hypothetical protein